MKKFICFLGFFAFLLSISCSLPENIPEVQESHNHDLDVTEEVQLSRSSGYCKSVIWNNCGHPKKSWIRFKTSSNSGSCSHGYRYKAVIQYYRLCTVDGERSHKFVFTHVY